MVYWWMIFSKSCRYAIRAMIYVAKQETENYVPIRNISSQLDIPFHFLTKILQQLTEKNILVSAKGAKGGIRFAAPLPKINLYDIYVSIDGDEVFTKCCLGLNNCVENNPCHIHVKWDPVKESLKEALKSTTLDKVSSDLDGERKIFMEFQI